jgi:hypothetical protein
MNTRLLMTASALTMGLTGIALSFLPQELAGYLSWSAGEPLVLQLLGALYFGFAMLNWMAKASLIGGIYGRPVAIGNFTHFAVGGLALLKWVLGHSVSPALLTFTFVYALFALLFGYVFFTHPKLKSNVVN